MTDKQIITDGVRVDECCYFDYENDGYEDSCYIHQNECSAQNCYYKQLKRKEQECNRYKQVLDEIENYVLDNSDFDKSDKLTSNTGAYDILEIINEAKGQ